MNCPSFRVINYGVYDSNIARPKQAKTPSRCLYRFELELITEALDGVTYINDVAYPLKKGLFLCCKPGMRRYSQLPLRCHYVHLQTEDPELLSLLQSLPDTCHLSDQAPIRRVFQRLAALPPIGQADGLQVASLVLQLISLARQMTAAEMRTGDTLTHSHRAMLISTEDYIRSHLAEDLTLERLSGRAKFSPSHFHRIFTAYFGKPPHDFILSCRIEAAQAGLRSDRCSLIELAAACGFSSQSHFSAQFKKATGQTPLQYRKEMLSRLDP